MSFRIQSLHLKNYGNLPEFHCEKFYRVESDHW